MEAETVTCRLSLHSRLQKKGTFTIRLSNIFVAYLLLVSVMPSSLAAPSPRVISANIPNLKNIHSVYSENPCGIAKSEKTPSKPLRHPVKATLDKMSTVLKTALENYNHINKTLISHLYKSTMNMSKHSLIENLPKKQLHDVITFKRKHKNIPVEKLVHQILPELREELLVYGKAFDELHTKTVHTQSAKHIGGRNMILTELEGILRALNCEVETSVNVTNSKLNSKHSSKDKVIFNFPAKFDWTAMQTTDISTFTYYKNFLEYWIKVLDEVKAMLRRRSAAKKPINRQKMKRGTRKPMRRPTNANRKGAAKSPAHRRRS